MRNLPYGFDIYLVKTIRQIAQIYVAFSDKLNFTWENSFFAKDSHQPYLVRSLLEFRYESIVYESLEGRIL